VAQKTMTRKIIKRCILQDLLPNPEFHPIQYDSTTYFSNAAQKSRSIQKMSTAALKKTTQQGREPFQFPMISLETSDLSEMSTKKNAVDI